MISDAAKVTAKPEPVVFAITREPENAYADIGETVEFTVEATGEGLTYQWQNNYKGISSWGNSSLAGSRTATITVPVISARYNYYWRCVVTDANGEQLISKAALLSEKLEPVEFAITKQPEDVQAEEGETVQFTVEATGEGLTYQWQNSWNGTAAWNNSGLTGSKTATITVPLTSARMPYHWRCVITDANGEQLISDAAKVIEKTPERFVIDDVTYFILDGTSVRVESYSGTAASLNIPTHVVFDTIEYTVTEIGEEAFYGLTSLSSISLPNTINIIRKRAFAGCTNLSSMTNHD